MSKKATAATAPPTPATTPQRSKGRGCREISIVARRARALELRAAGQTYRTIGERLGITESGAYLLIQRCLTRLEREPAADLVRLELHRLDDIHLALWPKRAVPRVADTLLRIAERRARLLGLDAPTKIAATTPDGSEPYVPVSREDVLRRAVEILRGYGYRVEPPEITALDAPAATEENNNA